jgi:MacB-like periplasmic core domain
LIDTISWRNLPVEDPESLMLVGRIRMGRSETGFTYPQSRALRDEAAGVTLAAYSSSSFPVLLTASLTGDLEPPIGGQFVSGNYFNLLGAVPQAGRLIREDDDRVPDGHPVVVLSDGYWRRRFGRDPAIVGQRLRLSGRNFDIIGVTPPEFFGVEVGLSPDVFIPMMMQAAVMPVVGDLIVNPNMNRTWVQLLARLPIGRPRQARSSIRGTSRRLASDSGVEISPRPIIGQQERPYASSTTRSCESRSLTKTPLARRAQRSECRDALTRSSVLPTTRATPTREHRHNPSSTRRSFSPTPGVVR